MSELRWILLAGGIALIVGIYLFGTRNRQRPTAAELERATRIEPPRPASPPESARREPRISLDAEAEEPELELPEPPSHEVTETPSARFPEGLHAPRREGVPGGRVEGVMRAEPVARELPASRPAQEPMVARREDAPVRPPPSAPTDTAATTVPTSQATPGVQATPAAPRPPQKIVAIRVTAAHPERFDGALLREVVAAARFTHGRYEIFHRLDSDGRPVMSLASLLEPGTFDPARMDTAAYPGIAVFTVMPGPVAASRAFDELLDTARWLAHRLGGQLQDDRGAPLSVQRVFKLREEVLAFERSLGSAGSA